MIRLEDATLVLFDDCSFLMLLTMLRVSAVKILGDYSSKYVNFCQHVGWITPVTFRGSHMKIYAEISQVTKNSIPHDKTHSHVPRRSLKG